MTDATTALLDFAVACYLRLTPAQIDWEVAVLRERAILHMEAEAANVFRPSGDELAEAAA
jgi:hypothetical protein